MAVEVNKQFFTRINFWLWVVFLVFSIIAFAPIADWTWSSTANFVIFCGVTGMLLGMIYIAVELLTITPLLGLVQLIIAAVWAIFWLAAGAATADDLNSWVGYNKSDLSVACAFSWLCFLLSLALCGFAFLDMKAGKGISGRGSAPASAPAGTVPAGTVPAGTMEAKV